MNIQIVIPILNPIPFFFDKTIPDLQKQTISSKILLINSGSSIPMGEYEVITIDKQAFNHANTRNFALNYNADYYLFMTQDAAPYDNALIDNLLKDFIDPNVVVSYARQIAYSDADPIEQFARETNYPRQSYIKSVKDLKELGIKTFFSSNSCAMYRGNYFRKVNGFTPNLNTSEDMEYAARAILKGKKIAYNADAKVLHSHSFTLFQYWKRYVEIGKFFQRNQWILDIVSHLTKIEKSGLSQAKAELLYIIRKSPYYFFRSLIISIIKFIAFKYGLNK